MKAVETAKKTWLTPDISAIDMDETASGGGVFTVENTYNHIS